MSPQLARAGRFTLPWSPPVQPRGSGLHLSLWQLHPEGSLTGCSITSSCIHTPPKWGISSAPFPPREFLHLSRQKLFYNATLVFTKAVTLQASLGFQGSLSPQGQEGSKTSSYTFKTTRGFPCLWAVKTNRGLNPKAGSCKPRWGCDNSSSRSECSACHSPSPSSTTHSLSSPAAAPALPHWAEKIFCI